MINCFQLCTIWNYIKYSNKRRKWQYKNAYREMQQNKHLMKGSEERNVFSSILSLRNKAVQYDTNSNAKWEVQRAQDEESQSLRKRLLDNSNSISVPQFTNYKIGAIGLHGFQDWFIPKILG